MRGHQQNDLPKFWSILSHYKPILANFLPFQIHCILNNLPVILGGFLTFVTFLLLAEYPRGMNSDFEQNFFSTDTKYENESVF